MTQRFSDLHIDLTSVLNTSFSDPDLFPTSNIKNPKPRKRRKRSLRSRKRKKIVKIQPRRRYSISGKLGRELNKYKSDNEEMKKLKQRVTKFRKKYRVDKPPITTDFLKKNIELSSIDRSIFSPEKSRTRKVRQKSARERKLIHDLNHMDYVSRLEVEIRKKTKKANSFFRESKRNLTRMERAFKWLFLVKVLSRFQRLKKVVDRKQNREKAIARRIKIENLIARHFSPFLEQVRRKKWKPAFKRFRNYFVFYRLWMTIDRKKKASSVIIQTINSTQIQHKFRRQIRVFTRRVAKSQFYIKKSLEVMKAQKMIMLYKYNVIEAKMLMGGEAKFNKSRILINHKRNKKLNLLIIGEGGKDYHHLSLSVGYFCLIVPTHEKKLQMLEDLIVRRNRKFERKMAIYERDLKNYQLLLIQKEEETNISRRVRKIMYPGAEGDKMYEDKLIEIHQKYSFAEPVKPVRNIYIADFDLRKLVVKGFRYIRKQEAIRYEKFLKEKKSNVEFNGRIEKGEHLHGRKIAEDEQNLRKYFAKSSLFDDRTEMMLKNAKRAIRLIKSERKERFRVWNDARLYSDRLERARKVRLEKKFPIRGGKKKPEEGNDD